MRRASLEREIMRHLGNVVVVGVAAAILAGCSSSGTAVGPLYLTPGSGASTPVRSASGDPTQRSEPRAPASRPTAGRSGAFCDAARKIGVFDLRVMGDRQEDRAKLLDGLDRLEPLAPADLQADYRVFDRFEHQLLSVGNADPTKVDNLVTPAVSAAVKHVGSYFTDTCHIGA
jgi:hypothetical protein